MTAYKQLLLEQIQLNTKIRQHRVARIRVHYIRAMILTRRLKRAKENMEKNIFLLTTDSQEFDDILDAIEDLLNID